MSSLHKIQWVPFRNDSGETVPACAVIRITGFSVADKEQGVLTADQSNTYGSQYSHAINSEFPVSNGKIGMCCLGQVAPARYQGSDGTPAFGELWGPRDNEWYLKKNTPGFMVLGLLNDSSQRVLVTPSPFLRFRGVALAESLEGSDDNEVAIYSNGATYGIYGDTGVTFENVVNEFGDFDNGAVLEVVWEGDGAGLRWKIIQATCPAT